MLTHEVAQTIVNRTMNILPYNINVMNADGVIIGSGDLDRIGTTHEVAKEIVGVNQAMEVKVEEESEWAGVKPGINLPIFFQGEVSGVVGITGDPGEVRRYGELVKMTAEMVMEQAYLHEQIQLDQRIKREFVNQWIAGKAVTSRSFSERAKTLGITLGEKRGIIVIRERQKGKPKARERLDKYEKAISHVIHQNDVMTVQDEELIIVKSAQSDKELADIAGQWLSFLGNHNIIFGLGLVSAEDTYVTSSYQQAKATLDVANTERLTDNLFRYDVYATEVLLHDFSKKLKDNHQFPFENPLPNKEGNEELIRTLHAYIEANGHMNETAKKLFIHRNTLHYRFDKIEEVSGYNPRNLKHLFYLYFSNMVDNSH